MEDIGLFKQGWKWLLSHKHVYSRSRTAISGFRDEMGMFIERHWPMVCSGCTKTGRLLLLLLIYWRDCVVRGFRSFLGLGSAALLLIMWSCFLSLTSISCLIYVLLSMVCSLSHFFKTLQHFNCCLLPMLCLQFLFFYFLNSLNFII